MNRRILPALLVVVLVSLSNPALFSQEEKQKAAPVPYEKNEFPGFLQDLRRGEIIFFGSVPITFLLSGLGWELGQAVAGDTYPFSNEQHTYNILITAGALSLGIAVLDYILGLLD